MGSTKQVIKVENLSKKYNIYHEQKSPYSTLVETITGKFKALCRGQLQSNSYEEFWALQDINFSIQEGDRVGIIGKNGAGKSSLLKVLARIVEPTEGRVTIHGRVSSLLEVGTGFHPELSGRENIYLNGAILGMSRHEIKRKFDDIVNFAEVEKFLDTPVKRFSSGMHARLGFAIAAHLDPEIFIVDEVLAVGDAQFQQKCLKKLNHLSNQGRTVIFVSHDIGAVMALCNKGIYLEKGRINTIGNIDDCANAYMLHCRSHNFSWEGSAGDEHIRFDRAALLFDSNQREFIYRGENVRLEVEYEILKPNATLVLGIGVWNQRNQQLARSYTSDNSAHSEVFMKKGKHKISFTINTKQFHEGNYLIKLDCLIPHRKHILRDEISLKFPIFTSEKQDSVSYNQNEGISLGSEWDFAHNTNNSSY